MTGPGDDRAAAAGGHGYLRAGHADRDQTVNVLKAAFVQGRLARDEFEQRLGQALTSRTYADLRAVTADLPAGLVPPAPAAPPAPARDTDHRVGVRVIAWLTVMCTVFWLTQPPGGSSFFGGSLFFVLAVLTMMPGVPVALILLHARMERRASSQLPPGRPPGGGGRPGQRTGLPQRGRQHPPGGPGHTAFLSALAS